MPLVEVKYQVATYKGSVYVNADPDEDNETIIAIARKKAIRIAGGSLPFGYESWTVIRKNDEDEG